MYPDNSFDSRATTTGKRDVQRERDYKHEKGANKSVSTDWLLNVRVGTGA